MNVAYPHLNPLVCLVKYFKIQLICNGRSPYLIHTRITHAELIFNATFNFESHYNIQINVVELKQIFTRDTLKSPRLWKLLSIKIMNCVQVPQLMTRSWYKFVFGIKNSSHNGNLAIETNCVNYSLLLTIIINRFSLFCHFELIMILWWGNVCS